MPNVTANRFIPTARFYSRYTFEVTRSGRNIEFWMGKLYIPPANFTGNSTTNHIPNLIHVEFRFPTFDGKTFH